VSNGLGEWNWQTVNLLFFLVYWLRDFTDSPPPFADSFSSSDAATSVSATRRFWKALRTVVDLSLGKSMENGTQVHWFITVIVIIIIIIKLCSTMEEGSCRYLEICRNEKDSELK